MLCISCLCIICCHSNSFLVGTLVILNSSSFSQGLTHITLVNRHSACFSTSSSLYKKIGLVSGFSSQPICYPLSSIGPVFCFCCIPICILFSQVCFGISFLSHLCCGSLNSLQIIGILNFSCILHCTLCSI